MKDKREEQFEHSYFNVHCNEPFIFVTSDFDFTSVFVPARASERRGPPEGASAGEAEVQGDPQVSRDHIRRNPRDAQGEGVITATSPHPGGGGREYLQPVQRHVRPPVH